jgi:hypothetical protein
VKTEEGLLDIVREIMSKFTNLTGLSSEKAPRRYLWTDAFAVCNFLELHHRTGEEKYKQLALLLVDQVHHVLGRHRKDDPRTGWISGLSNQKGEKHPTIGGLRIGKELNEREPGEPLDMRLEWNRDGQYYHYLVKWMHALNRVSHVTGDLTFNQWAVELAKTAHSAFIYMSPFSGEKRIYWKMSIDLSYPLISSMGQHDPLDGFITYNQLRALAVKDQKQVDLNAEIADMINICEEKEWTTDDPLGIGGLLCNAYEVVQLVFNRYWKQTALIMDILKSSQTGIELFLKGKPMQLPADCRLAFRELGLSLGLHSVKRFWELISEKPNLFDDKQDLYSLIENMLKFVPLIQEIEGFWLKHMNQQTDSWTEYLDINMVMLATTLAPGGYLGF